MTMSEKNKNRKLEISTMKEIFKKIPDFERYSISNFGNVINNVTGQPISQRKATNGYLRFNVRKGNVKYEKPTTLHTHRTVCELFIPKVTDKAHVNHIDGNKENNKSDNLEWVTPRENSQHAYNNIKNYKKAIDSNIKKAQESNKIILDVWQHGKYLGRYKGKEHTADLLGIDQKTIYNTLRGMTNRKGYAFSVVNGGG